MSAGHGPDIVRDNADIRSLSRRCRRQLSLVTSGTSTAAATLYIGRYLSSAASASAASAASGAAAGDPTAFSFPSSGGLWSTTLTTSKPPSPSSGASAMRPDSIPAFTCSKLAQDVGRPVPHLERLLELLRGDPPAPGLVVRQTVLVVVADLRLAGLHLAAALGEQHRRSAGRSAPSLHSFSTCDRPRVGGGAGRGGAPASSQGYPGVGGRSLARAKRENGAEGGRPHPPRGVWGMDALGTPRPRRDLKTLNPAGRRG